MLKNLLVLTIIAIALSEAKAQFSEYGAVESFYEANPDLVGGSNYAGRSVNPNYLLVDWSRHDEIDQRMLNNGFVRLGSCNWFHRSYQNGVYYGGEPQKNSAIGYARVIGADVVIYSCYTDDEKANHWVSFYAKQGSNEIRKAPPTNSYIPSNAVASAAMNRLQDYNHDPHVKGGVWYDAATDTFNWIGPKFGRHMSQPRTQFLSEIGPFLN